MIGPGVGDRETDHSLRLEHEVDHRGRDAFRRAYEIAFILTIFIIRNDNELPCRDIGECLLHRSEHHCCSFGVHARVMLRPL